MESLRVESVSKNFDTLSALRNVTLTVRNGERRAIVGPNGAGKTTLLNLLSGQLKPSAGRIHIFDRDVTNLPIYRRIHLGLACTFQVMNLMPALSVLDNVQLAIQAVKPFCHHVFRSRNHYTELLEEAKMLLAQWGLWEKRNDLVRELSYGQQRRIELIMALASKPRILLLDEPTSGFAQDAAASFMDVIRELDRSITLVIVEHEIDVVFELADYITVLSRGEVIAEGTREEIKANTRVRQIYLGAERPHNAAAK